MRAPPVFGQCARNDGAVEGGGGGSEERVCECEWRRKTPHGVAVAARRRFRHNSEVVSAPRYEFQIGRVPFAATVNSVTRS